MFGAATGERISQLLGRISGNIYVFWFLLTIPLLWLSYHFFILNAPGGLVFYWSGVFGVWFLFASLAITPMVRLFRNAPWNRWLVKRRRYIGVAAFAYCLLHTVYWFLKVTWTRVINSFVDPLVLFGWIGLFIMIAMAATSNDWSVRRMGINWKRLQRWVYLAVPLALLHWFMAERFHLKTVIVYGGILAIIAILRLAVRRRPKTGLKQQ